MPDTPHSPRPEVAVIGAGPAGLMAAEVLAEGGAAVEVFDHMPSAGRKLLIAGRGGLNLTHSEPLDLFLGRDGAARERLDPAIRAFPPGALIAWAEGLGQETFTGSSGRVFPKAMKASPLLRAWLRRLAGLGVALRVRHRWSGLAEDGTLSFATPEGEATRRPAATVLALGGASWAKLGSDGTWPALLPGVAVTPFRPSNCGFRVRWSSMLQERFAGTPLKRIALSFAGATVRGEAILAAQGIEGGAVYALSAALRDAIAASGPQLLHIDLRPDVDAADLHRRLDTPRRGLSLSNFLRRVAGLPPVAIALVQEAIHAGAPATPLAALVKVLPVTLEAPAPIDRAISSAGGLAFDELDSHFMLRHRPGLFACGEMLDWEAPTGGYLLQACMATGRAAGQGALGWLAERERPRG